MKISHFVFIVVSVTAQSCATTNLPGNSYSPSPQNSEQRKEPISDEIDFYPISPCKENQSIERNRSSHSGAIEGGVLNQHVKCGTLPDAAMPGDRSSDTLSVEV